MDAISMNFFIDFSKNCKGFSAGTYKSNDGKQVIEIVSTVDGAVVNEHESSTDTFFKAARVGHNSRNIQIRKDFIDRHTSLIILFIMIWCYFRPDSESYTEADIKALKEMPSIRHELFDLKSFYTDYVQVIKLNPSPAYVQKRVKALTDFMKNNGN